MSILLIVVLWLILALLASTIVLFAVNAYRRENGHKCWFCGKNPCGTVNGNLCQ